MLFEKTTPLDFILKDLFYTYLERVPNVKKNHTSHGNS